MIKLGDAGVSKLYLGDTEIKKAYVGEELVYNSASSEPGIALPDGYKQVQYLESKKSALGPGVSNVLNDILEFELFERFETDLFAGFYGNNSGDTSVTKQTGINCKSLSDGKFRISLNDGLSSRSIDVEDAESTYFKIRIEVKNGKITVNSIEYHIEPFTPSDFPYAEVGIIGGNQRSIAANGKTYRYTFTSWGDVGIISRYQYADNTLVARYIPCKKVGDNKGIYYEIVSKTFHDTVYSNSGDSTSSNYKEVVAGPEV